jgi:hypothetical protein
MDKKSPYLFALVNPGPPSRVGWLQFYEVCEQEDCVAVDPVHGTVDIFYVFSSRKIIPSIPKIPGHHIFTFSTMNFSIIIF